MDVTRPLLPLPSPLAWRTRMLPPGLLTAAGSGAGAATATASASKRHAAPEIAGAPDGADIVLPSGVRIRRTTTAGRRVTQAALLQAIRGIQQLPLQHQVLVARAGIAIELIPLAQLEAVTGTTHPVLGATAVNQDDHGRWVPTRIRIAVDSPISARGGINAIGEVTQHEIGHAIAVLATQDRSEDAARRYAAAY